MQLPCFTHTWWQRGPGHPLWAAWGLTYSNSSSHCPPLLPPQEAPMLLPCLIMWARCLGVSLCQPVALSASIMPLNGRPRSLSVCVCVSVGVWTIVSAAEMLCSPAGFLFSVYLRNKTRKAKGRGQKVKFVCVFLIWIHGWGLFY